MEQERDVSEDTEWRDVQTWKETTVYGMIYLAPTLKFTF